MLRSDISNMAISHTGHRKAQVSARTMCSLAPILLLQFLLTFAQGQGHGTRTERGSIPPIDQRISFSINEEEPPGKPVGTLPVQTGLTYRFSDPPAQFKLDPVTGVITTAVRIDRESLDNDYFDLFVESEPVARHLLQVNITVMDINDNSPVFRPSVLTDVSFSETDRNGTQVILETATDRDIGINGVTANYNIVSGNEDGKFRLVIITETSKPVLYLENIEMLDREVTDKYTLNISAQDGANPPKFGYLTVHVNVRDFNDNPPLFDQSDYSALMNETVPPGTSVVQVHATDLDSGANGDINYIVSNDDGKQFTVDRKTGVVSTSKQLKCERQSCQNGGSACGSRACVVTISAQDNGTPKLIGRAYVTVILIDENDHDPKISIQYSQDAGKFGTINEGAALDQVVATVSVTDDDDGLNGETALYIKSGNERGHFKKETVSFVGLTFVKVAGRLDREVIGKYNLTLVATDKGAPPRSATAFLIIMVNDVNDHNPVFQKKSYSARLSELSPVGSFVAGITATDNDTGINAQISYSIASGNDYDWFKIDQNTGLVTTKQTLDHEKSSSANLVVRAQDSGISPRHTLTNLAITIWDENDEVPTFSRETFRVSLEEGSSENTEVIIVKAEDGDQGVNGSVVYSFDPSVESKYPGVFQLDSSTGRITTKVKLDRETVPSYAIKVKASDQGNPPLFSIATILLKVIDINDNSPIFYPVKYYASVKENVPVQTSVIIVKATDKDEGQYGDISFSIKSGASGKFAIDSKSGIIKTSGALDRKQTPFYRLTVGASDGSREADVQAVVDISVIGVSDNPPAFTQVSGYDFSIVEDADGVPLTVGRSVGQVQASTSDTSASISYVITGGDPLGLFAIDSKLGAISTAKKVNREEGAFYSLKVTARAGNRYGTTSVNITVNDVNDNAPRFAVSKVDTYVIENWPVGHNVYHALAEDPDYGDNSKITYSLTADSSDKFKIRPSTGVVYLNKPVGSTNSRYTVRVVASDGGSPPKTATMEIGISVSDVNDHTPKFKQTSYEVSLIESVQVNSRFFQVTAVDADSGKNGELQYSIVKGNVDGRFGIFPDGVMYVAQNLDREDRDNYVLTVAVSDNGVEPRTSSVNVTVHILDANDNAPEFLNSTYNMYIAENQPASSYIGTVKAVDIDLGHNGEVSYKLEGVSLDISIHPRTGVLTSLRQFDREAIVSTFGKDSISVVVIASDNAQPKKQQKTVVNVHVLDENDETPKFTRSVYTPSVIENVAVNTPVIKIVATDADTGNNAIVRYSLISGNIGGKFAIDDSTGQIRIAAPLDREVKDTYQLVVMATDLGSIPKNNTVTVSVTVKDFNDNAPVFEKAELSYDVIETLHVGEVITQVTATDRDIGNNAVVSYAITAGNVDNTFHIDPNSGKIFLQLPLDYERRHRYVLNVTSSDFGSPVMRSTMGLIVNVRDFNDNPPVFPPGSMVRQITEGIPVNSPIVTVTANDKDSGINGELRYSIKSQEPVGKHFVIDSKSGQIKSAAEIDREQYSRFKLTVVATDQAIPSSSQRSSQKLVTIIVNDVNDNAPKFVSMDAVTVTLETQINSKIGTIKATDPDADANGAITYEITGGATSTFDIDREKGDLILKSTLNRNILIYTLSIAARDKGSSDSKGQQSTTAVFTIITRSTVDNGAQFSKATYSGEVYENEKKGTVITTVTASYQNQPNARIDYYITGITSSGVAQPRYFQIDKSSGKVTTTEPLDRENGYEVFYVEVYVVDRSSTSPKTRSTQVRVTLLDRNDNAPKFTPTSYTETVAEDAAVGYTVIQVSAVDLDEKNVIKYSITEGNDGSFQIGESTGTVTLLRKLDRERKETYDLKVVASDGKQSSFAPVLVKVTDVNDEPPRFLKPMYSFDIHEDTRVGTTVGRVSAIDPDLANNAKVIYSVASEWGKDKFNFNTENGIFTLASEIDYEEVHQYIITICAQDSGSPPLSSTVTVYMNIIDVNDNAPVFEQGSYSKEISEGAKVGASVLTVSAADVDSGINGKVRYSLIGGDTENAFGIDADNGTIFTKAELDRESQAYYNLVVMATDEALPITSRHSSTGTVTVYLADVNDNAPVFQSSLVTTVMENTHLGTSVFRVVAEDEDEGRNKYLGYSLGPVPGNVFILEPVDGVLKVNGPLDREQTPEYKLQVTATDKGSPPKATTAQLIVKIGDENDNSPQFSQKEYQTEVYENIKIGTSLLSVLATDRDEDINADIRYTIIDGDDNLDFYIDTRMGDISVNKRLDYERKQSYRLKVEARDLGEISRADTAFVNITINDVNDNGPVFADSPYKAYVQEHMTNLPVYVIRVTANDADSEKNAKVTYNIGNVIGGDRSMFSINSTSGEVKVHRTLDREIRDYYEVIVRAVDSGSPRQTGSGTIQVHVADINDHAPVFLQSQYTAHVQENMATNTPVVKVTAVDADIGDNAAVSYSIFGKSDSNFAIDANSGRIYTRGNLNREEKDQYDFVVAATDHGTIPKVTSIPVKVIVDDANDNVPVFDQKTYIVYIKNPALQGSFVLGVTAQDADLGVNGDIVYSLFDTSGTDSTNFVIDQSTGVISCKNNLPFLQNGYKFQARATDKGTNSLSNETSITVLFLSASSSSFPSFSSGESSFQLSENTRVDYTVTTVRATSPGGSAVSYHIAGGNLGRHFSVTSSGAVKVVKSLDYELRQSYSLWIEARDNSAPPLSSHIELRIQVKDENDNVPIFVQNLYNSSVMEENFPPLTVTTVSATDADSEANGRLVYRIINADGRFEIGFTSGVITTASTLDRETVDHYSLIVEAKDQGSPALSATATVDVKVLDKNDQPPKFTQHFNTKIYESLPVGSFVIKITSTDKDVGQNAEHTYEMVNNVDQKFQIDKYSGNVTVAGELDRETKDEYDLKITATDGAYKSGTTLTIIILDVNDNAPEFVQNSYDFRLVEGAAEGTSIGRVSASDRDAPCPQSNPYARCPSSEVFYRLRTASKLFRLNTDTGEITSRASLVYKMTSDGSSSPENLHTLTAVAYDRGDPQLSSEVRVRIQVQPANKNTPVFESTSYTAAVSENAVVGQLLVQVKARDEDVGENAEIEYIKSSGSDNNIFIINKTTGWISTSAPVKGLQGRTYVIVITARDKGLPPKSSSVNVTIQVSEQNLYAPEFVDVSFSATFPENAAIKRVVSRVTAQDRDVGLNGLVLYSITQGDPLNQFSIDSNGVIRIEKALDYETESVHIFQVTAQDRGLIPRQTSRNFTLYVTDVNDNPPVFPLAVYDAYVEENSPSGTFVFTAQATDPDTPVNGVIEYSITGSSEVMNKFSIRQDTGVITTQGLLNYETKNLYTISLSASNPGTALSSTTMLRVHVTGVNEYTPRFLLRSYLFVISESAKQGQIVGTVQATDNDGGEDAVVLYYLIGDSNLKGFIIDHNTGDVKISGQLDRESASTITLRALAKNKGPIKGNDTDECEIKISIKDANDAPVFSQPRYAGQVEEDKPPGSAVVRVSAVDNDLQPEYRKFKYIILSGNTGKVFRVDEVSGWIATNGKLDREQLDSYQLSVGAVDSGTPPKTGTAQVDVTIQDVNDNPPYFVPAIPMGNVSENRPPNSDTVIDLKQFTYDKDLSPNQGPYQYSLQDYSSLFSLDKDSGVLRTKVQLDREQVSQYKLRVIVTDNGVPSQTSTLTFNVRVLDVNDNPSTPRQLNVVVNSYTGIFNKVMIADVRPLDVDAGGDYRCSVVSSPSSKMTIPRGCELHAEDISSEHIYNITTSGNDGIHGSVNTYSSVHFKLFFQGGVKNTVVMRLTDTTPSNFLQLSYAKFVKVVSSKLTSGQSFILYGLSSDGENHVDLYMAAKKQNGGYVTVADLQSILNTNRLDIESAAQVKIGSLPYRPCLSVPCKNNGQCSDSIRISDTHVSFNSDNMVFTAPGAEQTFSCTCGQGYTGVKCETALDRCSENPCKHAGTCYSGTLGSFRCECTPSWTGATCEQRVNVCAIKNPCQNGGECKELPESYVCTCPSGFTGRHCESSQDVCDSKPCLNDGTCTSLPSNKYQCNCRFGDRGEQCEVGAQGFRPLSFMEFSSLDVADNHIVMEFATNKANVLLLYNPGNSGEFLSLEVIQGHVRFSFSLDKNEISRIIIPRNVADGSWYKIDARRNGKFGSLKISECPSGGAVCSVCADGDGTCHKSVETRIDGSLDVSGHHLSVGGVQSFDTIKARLGQVTTHDFVGCIRNIQVNSVDLLKMTPIRTNHTTARCERQESQMCRTNSCQNGGTCVDEWSTLRCRCTDDYMGQFCEKKREPFSFGPNTLVEYKQKESYRRDALLSQSGSKRRRRATTDDTHTVSVEFTTSQKNALLFYSSSESGFTMLHVNDGKVSYTSSMDNTQISLTSGGEVTNSQQNVSIVVQGQTVKLTVGSEKKEETFLSAVHSFMGVDLQRMFVAGSVTTITYNGRAVPGFEGCISEFRLDGEIQPFSGSTDRFTVISSGSVNAECKALVPAAGSLSIVVIIIIVFFVVILIIVVISFVVIRHRRRQKKNGDSAKQNGTKVVKANGLSPDANDSGRSHGDSGYNEHDGDFSEEMIIRQHIVDEMSTGKFNEREVTDTSLQRPDIIAPELSVHSQMLDSQGGHLSGIDNDAYQEEPPEHYDLENASSIAPSDIDVVHHYKSYRDGRISHHAGSVPGGRHRPHTVLDKPPRESPVMMNISRHSPASYLSRESPIPQKLQSTPFSHSVQPSPLTVNNLARASPMPMGRPPSRATTPLNQLSRSQTPNIPYMTDHQASALVMGSMPVTDLSRPGSSLDLIGPSRPSSSMSHMPVTDLSGPGRPSSRMGVLDVSGHQASSISGSNASMSDITRGPNLVGSRPASRLGSRPPSRMSGLAGHQPLPSKSRGATPTIGLTVEEVERLNARPHTQSLVSTIDAVSTSTDEVIRNNLNNGGPLPRPGPHLLPPDSTSEDSSNDSFTCSEFEYENEKVRNDLRPGAMIFSKLAEIDENDDTDYDHEGYNGTRSWNGSLSTLLPSEDEMPHSKNPNGNFNWDYLLNWGPSFEKLVGVFKDIAQLPDDSTATTESEEGHAPPEPVVSTVPSKQETFIPQEEYV